MFSTIQIIILVVLTLLLFILGPYLIILREKKLNQNRIQKISPKGKIIFNLFIGIIVISFSAFLMHVNNKPEVKKESKPVPTPQIETKYEYYYKKGEYGTKYKLTEQDKPYRNEKGKLMLNNVGEIEEPLIEKTYTFFGFNGFDQCQYKDKIPKDLIHCIKEPFNKWCFYKNPFAIEETNYFSPAYFNIDTLSTNYNGPVFSVFNNSFVEKDDTIKMDYEGPKYLLEEDKDFYVNEVKCPIQMANKKVGTTTYYLHFNPKKQYITLYNEKMNIKEKK
ncbi:hypothetical protein [Candidatus Phytoplasma sp. AldY-WA1]|uniref:hypothetical protein n=1 Tax=Candidatus Phytoplasma sp. AldY-WA1 TaxID=2852100 RepID=UPI00254C752B|nr:hypothetical protein [Candidatus Phytoplasma sp. AldY-WA1]